MLKATATKNSIKITANVPYAETQDKGNPHNKLFGKHDAPIPARHFFVDDENDIPPELLSKLVDLIKKHLEV